MSTSFLRRASIVIAGGGVYGTAAYLTYHYLQMQKGCPNACCGTCGNSCQDPITNPQRTQQFQSIAHCYDDSIGRDEFFLGINLLRRALLYFHAGDNDDTDTTQKKTILEVGAGTGRNLPYFPENTHSNTRILLTDTSDQMLAQATAKIRQRTDAHRFAVLAADAAHLEPILPTHSVDIVIDTFGLCSYNDPVAVLRELSRICKPNGKILLLEHGRSKSWDFVTQHLDRYAMQHAQNWGCVWNRDLDAIVQAANLRVDIQRCWHFGTTYYMVCRPPAEAASDNDNEPATAK